MKSFVTQVIVACCCLTLFAAPSMANAVGDGEYIQFYHADMLGSPLAVTDGKGRVLWYENTEPYGKSLGRVSADGTTLGKYGENSQINRFGYTGHTLDSQLSAVYMKARYYDPDLGRFYSDDPVGFKLHNTSLFNRYAYANNNPYRYNDPDGRQAEYANEFDFGYSRSPAMYHRSIDVFEIGPSNNTRAMMMGVPLGIGIWAAMNSADKPDSDEKSDGSDDAKPRTNKVTPDAEADGAHTTWKTDPQTGKITRHETWTPNPQNPTGWDTEQSTDMQGAPHVNKQTGTAVPTPHTQGRDIPGGVRPATPEEIPNSNDNTNSNDDNS